MKTEHVVHLLRACPVEDTAVPDEVLRKALLLPANGESRPEVPVDPIRFYSQAPGYKVRLDLNMDECEYK